MRTLETMVSLARRGASEPGVQSILTGMHSYRDIDTFLRRVFVYREERDEVLRDVPFMLNDLSTIGEMQGDCDDMTIMGSALCCAAGYATRMTAIKSQNPDEFDHVFTEVRIGSFWLPIDPTVPSGTTYMQFGFLSEAVC